VEIILYPAPLSGRHHHEDSKHVVDGIDKIEAAAGAVPAIFAKRPVGARRRRGANGEAKAEATGGVRKIEGIVNDPGLRADLIRRHQRHGLALEVALAVELAPIE